MIIAFSVPLLIGNIVQQLYQFADAMVVGRTLGVEALAAVGATGSIVFLVMGFAWGLTSGFAIPTAQAFGAQDIRVPHRSVAAYTTAARVDGLAVAILQSIGLAVSMFAAQNLGARRFDRIQQGIRQGMVVAIGASVLLGAVIVLLGETFVRAFVGTGEDTVVAMSHTTLVVWGLLYWILAALFILRGALQGLGDTIVPMWTGVVELIARVRCGVARCGARLHRRGVGGAVGLVVRRFRAAARLSAGLAPPG